MSTVDLFSSSPLVHHWGPFVVPNTNRTLFREFERSPRDTQIVDQVLSFSEEDIKHLLDQIWLRFSSRLTDPDKFLIRMGKRALARAGIAREFVKNMSKESIMLLGAYSSREYSTEGAALTNPSIIRHPDQSNLQREQTRVALSLRGIGEGHTSSIVFMTAILDPIVGPIASPRVSPQISGEVSVLKIKNPNFYSVNFSSYSDLSQRVLSPVLASESMGLEDARFAEMVWEDGRLEYRATYTAFDGKHIRPRIMISNDLVTFTSSNLLGPASVGKGMALFPEKINGRWMALCRGDGHTSSISESDDGIFWNTPVPLVSKSSPWDLLITGNAGSPHLTSAGWLVITHGVGPMRTYSLGAMLLDRADPSKVIGKLKGPLLAPSDEEAVGYVPNALYSCGSLIVEDTLWLPYGVSDRCASFASVNVKELVAEILKV